MKLSLIKKIGFTRSCGVALACFIQACGGGSGGGNPPVVPTEYTFSFSSVVKNDCGVETAFNDLELLVQDDNWLILERYSPNTNGEITFVTNQPKINYTLVAQNQTGNEAQGLNIKSYYQARTTTPVVYYAQMDSAMDLSSCECVTQDVRLTHRSFTTRTEVASSTGFTAWQSIDNSNTLLSDVEVCRAIGGNWPLVSFSVIGTDVNDTDIGVAVFSENFDENINAEWALSAFDVAEQVDLPQGHQAFETTQLIQNEQHFSTSVEVDTSSLLLFNSHDYLSESSYHSLAKHVFQETSSIFGTTAIESSHQIISSNYDTSFSVAASTVKPNIDDVNFSEIEADGTYDYSAVSNYQMAVISFDFVAYDPDTQLPMPVRWTTYGEIEGLLPIKIELTGYEDIIDADTSWKELDVQLLRSNLSTNYDDYMLYVQTSNDNGFADNLNRYHIKVTK